MSTVETHDVVVVGSGPTGMMLGAELTLAGVDVLVVERRAAGEEPAGSRSRGLHARTIEVLDLRGIADRVLEEGQAMQVAGFSFIPLDISDLPGRRSHGLALSQDRFERILAGWIAELGVPELRGRAVTGIAQDDDGVDVTLDDGRTLRARYVVGCDGGRSLVRKAVGIGFPGWDASVVSLIAEAQLAEEPAWGIRRGPLGVNAIGPQGEGLRAGIVLSSAPEEAGAGSPTLDDLRAGLTDVYGTDYGVHSPTWISRFTDVTRQAEAYRAGRVLLAGDAAHVHGPSGGQGLNVGVQDAFNLGWKLAQVVRGTSPDALLDTYHVERHPVAARVLRLTMAMTALGRSEDRIEALRTVVADVLAMDEPRHRYGAALSGLDVHYDLGPSHPLLGRAMPDLPLRVFDAGGAGSGSVWCSDLLHRARPVLLSLTPDAPDLGPWSSRVDLVRATSTGPWELPLVGSVPPPSAVLIRPDGHVCWVGEGSDAGLHDGLARWFGPAGTHRSTL